MLDQHLLLIKPEAVFGSAIGYKYGTTDVPTVAEEKEIK